MSPFLCLFFFCFLWFFLRDEGGYINIYAFVTDFYEEMYVL